MQTDDTGHTIPVTDPVTGAVRQARIFVAVLGASSDTCAWASLTQALPDWIEGQVRALKFLRGVPKAIACDSEASNAIRPREMPNKAAMAKPPWFEPSIPQTFADITVLPTRPRKPRE